ncbi:thermonuclease family protein [Polaromonas sp.]|uniref:thermonuclease family protein n=1 Tax=Polaromonas sp. TaxID=1869339 RepID=UPI00352BA87A
MLASSFATHAIQPRVCLVVGVSDGDTITARCGQPGAYEQVTVRIGAIDAPERRQPFGARAKEALSGLVFDKLARLDCSKTDRYRRSVCSVWVAPASAPAGPKTLDAGLAMITEGMAWWYRAYSREQTAEQRGQYEFAEQEASARRAGIWRDVDPVPPWQWRAERRAATPASN